MDPLFMALTAFKQRKFEKAAEFCGKALEKNPLDQAAWSLKTRCLTEQVYIDECENDDEGIAESLLDDNVITTALKMPRTAKTARPVTSSTGRFVRLGTASMLSSPDGPFINISRLNLSKYAGTPNLHDQLQDEVLKNPVQKSVVGDIRTSMQLAALATQAEQYKSWYWKAALGKCYYRLGLYRDAEKQFKSAQTQETNIDTTLLLSKVYIRLDQPLTAIEVYIRALDKFPADVHLLTALARIHEQLNDGETSIRYYKEVLKQDSTNVEAIACIGTHHFYSDTPEIALTYYRRLLQMGVANAELFTNIGLCCFYAQQFDLSIGCFERAIATADEESQSDVWYNLGHVALASGDTSMAYQCFRLSLTANNDHAEAFCNLGVLELRKGNFEQAKALLQSAMTLGDYTFEPFFNFALLCYQMGDYHAAIGAVKKAIQLFPTHADSLQLKKKIDYLLTSI